MTASRGSARLARPRAAPAAARLSRDLVRQCRDEGRDRLAVLHGQCRQGQANGLGEGFVLRGGNEIQQRFHGPIGFPQCQDAHRRRRDEGGHALVDLLQAFASTTDNFGVRFLERLLQERTGRGTGGDQQARRFFASVEIVVAELFHELFQAGLGFIIEDETADES